MILSVSGKRPLNMIPYDRRLENLYSEATKDQLLITVTGLMTDNNSLRTKKMQVLSGLDFGTLYCTFLESCFMPVYVKKSNQTTTFLFA